MKRHAALPGPITGFRSVLTGLQMNYVTQISQLGSYPEIDRSKIGEKELQEDPGYEGRA